MGLNSPAPVRGAGGHPRVKPVVWICRVMIAAVLLVSWAAGPLRPAGAEAPARPASALRTDPVVSIPDGAAYGAVAWGDMNNDGYQDLVVTGTGYDGVTYTRTTLFLYNKNSGHLDKIDLGLPRLEASSAAWGDYDNDGYQDLLLTGRSSGQAFSGIYHNIPCTQAPSTPCTPGESSASQRTFQLAFQLEGVYQGTGVWGDYDNDGRLDVLLSGLTSSMDPFTMLYHNDGGAFSPAANPVVNCDGSTSPLLPLGYSSAAFSDYDADGYADFAIAGLTAESVPTTLVYHNNQCGGFNTPFSLGGDWSGTLNWIDYDNNGHPDLLLTGNAGTNNGSDIQPKTRLFRTDPKLNPPFSEVTGSGLPDIWNSSLSVGDYNNDGYPDLVFNGLTGDNRTTNIFINDQDGTFSDAQVDLPRDSGISAAWGDYNRDRTLDLALSGMFRKAVVDDVPQSNYYTEVYLNEPAAPNAAPSAPVLQAACYDGGGHSGGTVTLHWSAGSDDHTPAPGLTYNLRVGTAPDAGDVVNPASSLVTGEHHRAEPGNQFTATRATLKGLTLGKSYTWSVQAEDASYVGGPFSPSASFNISATVGVNDTAEAEINTPLKLSVLDNDHQAVRVLPTTLGQPQHGTLALNQDGTLTYTPAQNYIGLDYFTYDAVNAGLACSRAQVVIAVKHTDHYPPTDIHLTPAAVTEGLPAHTLVGTLTTVDGDNPHDWFSYQLTPSGTNGYDNALFSIEGDKLYTRAILSTRQAEQLLIHVTSVDVGTDHLISQFIKIAVKPSLPTITWKDASGAQQPGPARVTVFAGDGPGAFKLSLTGSDPGSTEKLTWSLAVKPKHGHAQASGETRPGQAMTAVQYTPADGYFGPDSFVVQVSDPYCNTAQITVELIPGSRQYLPALQSSGN